MYIRAEAGPEQPRDLSGAFFKPVRGDDLLAASIEKLTQTARQLDACYGQPADKPEIMDVTKGEGSLAAIKVFARAAVDRVGADG